MGVAESSEMLSYHNALWHHNPEHLNLCVIYVTSTCCHITTCLGCWYIILFLVVAVPVVQNTLFPPLSSRHTSIISIGICPEKSLLFLNVASLWPTHTSTSMIRTQDFSIPLVSGMGTVVNHFTQLISSNCWQNT